MGKFQTKKMADLRSEAINGKSEVETVQLFGCPSIGGENLGGGFKYFLFSPLFGEDSHFD